MTRALRPEDLRDSVEEAIVGRIKVVTLDKIPLLSKTFDDGRIIRNCFRNGGFSDATRTNEGYVHSSENYADSFLDELIPPKKQLRHSGREFGGWSIVYSGNLLQ